MKRFGTLRTTLAIGGALFLCAQMSAEITVRGCRLAAESGGSGVARPRTVLSLFIGRVEALVGDILLLKADNYFHGQTSLLGRTRVGECEHGLDHHACACHEHHEHHEGEHHHAHGALAYDHFLYRQYVKVASTAHVHLRRHEEIVPWLYASVRLNPANERAAVVAAYWLARQLDEPREAERVLRAALAERPSSWRLRAALAWLHFDEGRFGPALSQCESALGLFEPVESGEDGAHDLAELWRLASACQEGLDHLDKALACAQVVVTLLPESEAARERLDELKALVAGRSEGPSERP